MSISAFMLVSNEEIYLNYAISSILNLVSELVIVVNRTINGDSESSIKIINTFKSKKIKLFIVDNKTKFQCAEMALNLCHKKWILRCDADMIFYDLEKFKKLVVNHCIESGSKFGQKKIRGAFLYAINFYGDRYHISKEKQYKTNDLFFIKKTCLSVEDNNSHPKYIYSNDHHKQDHMINMTETTHSCFIYHMSYCCPPERMLYQIMKYNYTPFELTMTFKEYMKSIHKDYYGSIRYIEKTIHNKILPTLNSFPHSLPFQIYFFTPTGKKDSQSYYDYILPKGDKIFNYTMTLTILVRNTEQYLKECLESVFEQTSKYWKIVLVNDCSDAGDINIDQYLSPTNKQYKKKIMVVNLKEWHGIPRAHSVAVSHVNTEIVGVLDSDDKLEPNAVEEILKVYNNTREEIFVYSNYWFCDKDFNKIELGYSYLPSTSIINERCASHFRTFMMKTYKKIYGYDSDLVFGAVDQDLFFQLERQAKPYYLHKYLYHYRYFGMVGTITTMTKANNYMLYVSVLKNIIRQYGHHQFTLQIYSTENMTRYCSSYSYTILGDSQLKIGDHKYYFEIHSHDILLTRVNYQDFKELLDTYLKQDSVPINVKWDNHRWVFTEKEDPKFMETHTKVTVNHYFNCVYVLNLKKDIEKRMRMEMILTELGIEYVIFDAIYGKDYMDEFNKIMTVTGTKYKSPGAFGYTMTMLSIFDDAKTKGYKKILTLDDDVIFHVDFVNKFNEYVRQIPHDWYLLFLGLSGPWTHPWVNKDFENFNFNKYYVNDLFNCDGSYAVGYDHRVFDEISEVAMRFIHPFDTAIMKHFREKHLKKCFAFYPYLVIADTTTSDISDREEDVEKNFLDYQFKYRVNLGEYNMKSLNHRKYDKLFVTD